MLPSKMSGVAGPKFEFWCSGHSFGSVFKKPPSAKLTAVWLVAWHPLHRWNWEDPVPNGHWLHLRNHQAAQWVHFHQQLAMKPGTWKWKWESQWLQMRSKKWHQFHDSPVLISKCIPNTFPRQSTEMDAAAAATKRRVNSIFPVFWTVESSESSTLLTDTFKLPWSVTMATVVLFDWKRTCCLP